MLTDSDQLIFASSAIAAMVVAAWLLMQWRRRHHVPQRDRQLRRREAWSDLQQRFIAAVEQDEHGGADVEELHRAVGRYHALIDDPAGDFGWRQVLGPKRAHIIY